MNIPNSITCLWCGSTAVQSGFQQFGFGLNSLSYWCPKCHCNAVYVRHTSKIIDSLEIKVNYKDDST